MWRFNFSLSSRWYRSGNQYCKWTLNITLKVINQCCTKHEKQTIGKNVNFLKIKNSERHQSLVHLRISVLFWTPAGREKMYILLQGNGNKFGPNNNLVLYAKLSKFESHLCQTVKKWKYLRRQQVMYLWTLVCKGQSCLCVSIARSSRAVHLIVEVLPGLV